MFDKVGDLPMHALVIHAVVIVIPIAVLLSGLFAFPRTRAWARWPLGLVALGGTAATFVARESGEALERALKITNDGPVGTLIAEHSRLATQLFLIMVIYAVVAVACVLAVSPRPLPWGAKKPPRSPRLVDLALCVALVVLAVLAMIWVYRVGDLGARAVWNPAGTVDYGG